MSLRKGLSAEGELRSGIILQSCPHPLCRGTAEDQLAQCAVSLRRGGGGGGGVFF
jgi:hypothetical protein